MILFEIINYIINDKKNKKNTNTNDIELKPDDKKNVKSKNIIETQLDTILIDKINNLEYEVSKLIYNYSKIKIICNNDSERINKNILTENIKNCKRVTKELKRTIKMIYE